MNDLSVSFKRERTEGRWRVTVSERVFLYYGTFFPSSFVNQCLIIPATIKPAPLSLYLRLYSMRNSEQFSSTDHSPLSLHALPPYVSSLVS